MTRGQFLGALNRLGNIRTFRVVINGGSTHEVEDPVLVMVAKEKVAIGIGLYGMDPIILGKK